MNAWQEKTNYYLCAIIVFIVVLQFMYLYILSNGPSVKYRQLTTGKKKTDRYKQMLTPAFLALIDHNCSICSKYLIGDDEKTKISELQFGMHT